MSAFLGPIHYWLYNKIKLQQELVEEILKLSEGLVPDLRETLYIKYDVNIEGQLEDIVDQSNIHGWLQYCVSQSEFKLADSVTILLENNPDTLQDVKVIFLEKGKEKSSLITTNSAANAFKVISDSLLDGMPCDHANSVLEENEDQVLWKRNTCVHKNYWEEVGGAVNNYYLLREEFIKGILSGTDLEFEKIDEVTSVIRKQV